MLRLEVGIVFIEAVVREVHARLVEIATCWLPIFHGANARKTISEDMGSNWLETREQNVDSGEWEQDIK